MTGWGDSLSGAAKQVKSNLREDALRRPLSGICSAAVAYGYCQERTTLAAGGHMVQ